MLKSLVPNIMVDSVDKTIEYYENVFDFKTVMCVPETGEKVWAMIQNADVSLMLQNRESIVKEMPEMKDTPIGGSLSFFVSTTDIDILWNEVKDKIDVIKEPFTTFYNTKEFVFKDINGYIITMAEHSDE